MKVDHIKDLMNNNSVSEGDDMDDDSVVNDKSAEIFSLPLKNMPAAVIEVVDDMENDDKEKLREEFGVSDREEGASDYNPSWLHAIGYLSLNTNNVIM